LLLKTGEKGDYVLWRGQKLLPCMERSIQINECKKTEV